MIIFDLWFNDSLHFVFIFLRVVKHLVYLGLRFTSRFFHEYHYENRSKKREYRKRQEDPANVELFYHKWNGNTDNQTDEPVEEGGDSDALVAHDFSIIKPNNRSRRKLEECYEEQHANNHANGILLERECRKKKQC